MSDRIEDGRDAWLQAWQAVSAPKRAAIRRAVRLGHPAGPPDEDLMIGYSVRRLRGVRIRLVFLLFGVGLAILRIVLSHGEVFSWVLLAMYLTGGAVWMFLRHRARRVVASVNNSSR